MKWLQWASVDMRTGIGSVEVFSRSLSRELWNRGVECHLSSDPADLNVQDWDVIQTHGSSLPAWVQVPKGTQPDGRPVVIHTLHGTTLGRMAACGEWFWFKGYLGVFRELRAVLRADIVLSVHSRIWLFRLARLLKKKCYVCSVGWDADAEQSSPQKILPTDLQNRIRTMQSFWVFVGQGRDPVKRAPLVLSVLRQLPELRIIAVPGAGFEAVTPVILAGSLTCEEMSALLKLADGLLMTSLYEGLPLVLMEALAMGTPVVTTNVGGIRILTRRLQGLIRLDMVDPKSLAKAIRMATRIRKDPVSRARRAQFNRCILSNWARVAERAIDSVREFIGEDHKMFKDLLPCTGYANTPREVTFASKELSKQRS